MRDGDTASRPLNPLANLYFFLKQCSSFHAGDLMGPWCDIVKVCMSSCLDLRVLCSDCPESAFSSCVAVVSVPHRLAIPEGHFSIRKSPARSLLSQAA